MSTKIALYAMGAGCCALVPVPLLDAWLERKVLRKMYSLQFEQAGLALDEEALNVLSEDRDSLLIGCLGVAVIWPIKKLFRTFFYFLTLKDMVDGAAAASIRAAMVDAAMRRLPGEARSIRNVMDLTLSRWRYSPITRFLTRGERPDVSWLAGTSPADRGVAWLYAKAGGGAILADYQKRLEELP